MFRLILTSNAVCSHDIARRLKQWNIKIVSKCFKRRRFGYISFGIPGMRPISDVFATSNIAITMSTRQATRDNREELRKSLLRDFRDGVLRSGDVLPPVRNLALKHNLSPATVQRVLRGLADEGVIQLRQGAGAFVGHLPEQRERAFVIVFGDDFSNSDYAYLRTVRDGFEAEIARRGGTPLTLTPQTPGLSSVIEAAKTGELAIGGSFLFGSTNTQRHLQALQIAASLPGPRVLHAENARKSDKVEGDSVNFDNRDGARQAVRHLWQRDHRDIALVGLNGPNVPPHEFPWSRLREEGFCETMRELKQNPLVFQPQCRVANPAREQQVLGNDAARQLMPLLHAGQVSAVICVNSSALDGLVEAANESGLVETSWPALIAFDDDARDDHLLSVLRLPWDDLGRAAALALWQRSFGNAAQKEAPFHEISIPMRLVARLSCRDHRSHFTGASSFNRATHAVA